jgi:hypothetical protein
LAFYADFHLPHRPAARPGRLRVAELHNRDGLVARAPSSLEAPTWPTVEIWQVIYHAERQRALMKKDNEQQRVLMKNK